jgi:hypothetical protein
MVRYTVCYKIARSVVLEIAMPAYAARTVATREFVGIVACEFDEEIPDLIEELCDPGICEVAELPSGMILAGPKAPMIPAEAVDAEALLRNASLTGAWTDAFGSEGDLEWVSMQEIYDRIANGDL